MKPKSTRAAAGMALGLLAALLGLGMAPPATAADAGMPGVCGRPDSLSGESLRFCAVHDASPAEVSCHSLKLRAVGQYYGCLLRATDDEARQARCDDQFARAFAHADRISPGCEPLDDLDRTQRGVQHQAREVLRGDVSPPPCAAVVVQDDRVTCELSIHDSSTSVSSVSLSGILDQLQGMSPTDCPPCAQITAQTVLWLQAWGATAGKADTKGREASPRPSPRSRT